MEHFWWGSVFLVNVPIIAVALLVGRVLLPKSKDPNQGRLDPMGSVLSTIGLSALVYAIIEAPNHGWASGATLLAFVAALVVIAMFALWEVRSDHPMLDFGYFRNPRFSVASAGISMVFFSMFGVFFLMAQYFQLVLGFTPFQAGLRQGPIALVMMLVAPNSARLSHRFGANRVVAVGLGFVATAMFLFTQMGTATSYLSILPVLCVMAAGMALTMSPMTASIMGAVPMRKAGVGSAINDTTRELGGALGVAVLGSLVTSRYDHLVTGAVHSLRLGDIASEPVQRSLAGALAVAHRLPGAAGVHLAEAAKAAFVSGMHIAVFVAGVIIAATAVMVYRKLPGSLTPDVHLEEMSAADAAGYTAQLGLGGVPTAEIEVEVEAER